MTVMWQTCIQHRMQSDFKPLHPNVTSLLEETLVLTNRRTEERKRQLSVLQEKLKQLSETDAMMGLYGDANDGRGHIYILKIKLKRGVYCEGKQDYARKQEYGHIENQLTLSKLFLLNIEAPPNQ